MYPGHATLTLMFVFSSSFANASVMAFRAVLDGLYAEAEHVAMLPVRVRALRQRADGTPHVDDAPCRRLAKERQHRLRNGRDAEHVGLEDRAHVRRATPCSGRSSSCVLLERMPAGSPAYAMAALFTSTSRRPNSLRMRSAAAAIEA